MARNIEIKARAADFEEQMARAAALADGPATQLQQRDIFYRSPIGRLKLRLEGERATLIGYARPDQPGPKLSDYRLYPVSEAEALDECLRQALPLRGVVAKQRTLYLVGQTRIHCDQVEGLGAFIELEVVLRPDQSLEQGQAIARELMARLAIAEDDLLDVAYIDLLDPPAGASTQGERHG